MDPVRDHSALAFIQKSAPQVLGDDVIKWITLAVEGSRHWLDSESDAGEMAVATI
jgi:hypothetical protein